MPPAAPSGLTATAAGPSQINLSAKTVSSSQIRLTWTDRSSNEDGFSIERSRDGRTFTQIRTVAANTTTYTDSGLASGTKYWYRLRAYNSAGNSAYSNTARANTLKR